MKHVIAVLCESCIVDRNTNSVSFMNHIETVNLRRQPLRDESDREFFPFNASFVIVTKRSDPSRSESKECRTRFRTPDGQYLQESVSTIDLTSHMGARTIIQFDVFPYAGTGEYQFIIEYEGEAAGSWIEVDKVSVNVNRVKDEEEKSDAS